MSQQLLLPERIEFLLRSWNVSEGAIALLIHEPEIVAHLEEVRSYSPFPPGYVPAVIEELFDDLPYRRWQFGQALPTYERQCLPDYDPPFVEYSFDDETALFHVRGEIIVDRITAISEYANRLEWRMPQEV
jgi:hypothetical protein